MPKPHNHSDIPSDVLAGVLGSMLSGAVRNMGSPFAMHSTPQPERKPQPSPVDGILNPILDLIQKGAGEFHDFITDTKPKETEPENTPKHSAPEPEKKPTVKRVDGAVPPMDIVDYKNRVEFRFAIAGLAREHINVELEDETLTILINPPAEDEEGTYLVRSIWTCDKPTERDELSYQKSFLIPTRDNTGRHREIDEGGIQATVKDGLFTVSIPFKGVQKTKITIQ